MGLAKHNHFIREAIRHLLRERKLRYGDLAKGLKISLPTVKRMMTKESMTIGRLTEICAWLGIEFYDLISLARSLQQSELQHLSVEQETFLVQSPQACRFLVEIMNFLSPEQIARKFGLNQKSVDLYLNDLRRAGLISRKSANLAKAVPELLRGPRPDGPLRLDLAKRYRKFIPTLVANELAVEVDNLGHSPPMRSKQTIAVNGFNLTKESAAKLLQELKDIRDRFAEVERIQAQAVDPARLISFTFLNLLVEGSVYAQAYGEIRNRG